MKTFILFTCCLFFIGLTDNLGQSVGINDDGSSPQSGHILDIKSNNQGLLIPRVTLSNPTLKSPVTGAINSTLIYNTGGINKEGFYYWNGAKWDRLVPASDGGVPAGLILLSETKQDYPGYEFAGQILEEGNFEFLGIGTGKWLTKQNPTNYKASSPSCANYQNLVAVWSGQDNSYLSYSNVGAIYNLNNDTWSLMSTTGAPIGRYGHATTFDELGGYMAVWGGVTSGDGSNATIVPTNTGGEFQIPTDNWIPMAASPLSARCFHSGVGAGGFSYYYWGGTNGTGTYYNDGAHYSGPWTMLSASPLSPRSEHKAVYGNGKMYIFGGRDGSTVFNDGAIYDTASDTWTMMNSSGAPTPRYEHAMVWADGKILIWGGKTTLTGSYSITGHIYDTATDTWSNMAPTPNGGYTILRVGSMAYGWLNGEMIIAGGKGSLATSDICLAYNISTDSWRYVSSLGISRSRTGFTTTTDGRFFVAGGRSGSISTPQSSCEILDPADPFEEDVIVSVGRILYKYRKM